MRRERAIRRWLPGTVAGDAGPGLGGRSPPLFFEPLSVVLVGHEARR
jgi:hypothetical protein